MGQAPVSSLPVSHLLVSQWPVRVTKLRPDSKAGGKIPSLKRGAVKCCDRFCNLPQRYYQVVETKVSVESKSLLCYKIII